MNLVAGEKPEEGFLETLHWDRQDLLHELQGWWALQRDVMGKGANGGQPCIAAAHRITTLRFQIGQKVEGQRRIEVVQR